MKPKLLCTFLLILALSIFSFGQDQDVVEIKTIGTNPLFKGGFTSAEHMRETFKKSPVELREAMELAGHGDLVEAFMVQFADAEIESREIAIGEIMPWMAYRKRGKITLIQNAKWMGKQPLQVYAFSITAEGTRYHFIVPAKCGNLSFYESEELPRLVCDITVTPQKANIDDVFAINVSGSENSSEINVQVLNEEGNELQKQDMTLDNPVMETSFDTPGYYTFKVSVKGIDTWPLEEECEAVVYVNHPPVCDLSASAEEIIKGEKLILDATGSYDVDGSLTKADFKFLDKEGELVMAETMTEEPFILEPEFPKRGMYTINLVVEDDFNAVSDICTTQVNVRPRLLFFVELAPSLVYGSYTYYTSVRGGLLYRIVPRTLDLKVSAGAGISIRDKFKDFFMAGATLNLNFSEFFIGAGLGYSTKYLDYLERESLEVEHGDPMESGMDAIFTLGYNVIKDKGTIFGEARIPFGGNRKFENQHIFLAGFTYYF